MRHVSRGDICSSIHSSQSEYASSRPLASQRRRPKSLFRGSKRGRSRRFDSRRTRRSRSASRRSLGCTARISLLAEAHCSLKSSTPFAGAALLHYARCVCNWNPRSDSSSSASYAEESPWAASVCVLATLSPFRLPRRSGAAISRRCGDCWRRMIGISFLGALREQANWQAWALGGSSAWQTRLVRGETVYRARMDCRNRALARS